MLAHGIQETTATTGTGTITLAAVAGRARFSDAFSVGESVAYAIQDGNNWEWGIGTVGTGNTLNRSIVIATYSAGVYTKHNATALTLSGSATIICTDNLGAMRSIQVRNLNHRIVAGGNTGRALLGFAITAARQYYVPFMLRSTARIVELGITVSTALAGSASLGIYSNVRSAGNDIPNALLASVTALDTGTTGYKSGAVSVTLQGGTLYWISAICSAAANVLALNYTADATDVLGRRTSDGSPVTLLYESGSGSTLANPASATQTYGEGMNAPGIFMREG